MTHRLFFSSIKSEATKNAYVIYLRKYVQTLNYKTVNDLLSVKDSKQIENQVINFIIKMKEAGMNFRVIIVMQASPDLLKTF